MSIKEVRIEVRGGVVDPTWIPEGIRLKITDHDNEATYICVYDPEVGRVMEYPEE